MKWLNIGLLLITLSGCSGGGGSSTDTSNPASSPAPHAAPSSDVGGLWSGAVFWDPKDGSPGGALNARAMIAETGEFRMVLYEDVYDDYFGPRNQQVFGTFRTTGGAITTAGNAVWAAPLNATADDWAVFGMAGEYAARDFISGDFQANFAGWGHVEERVGTLAMHYHSIYERPSSLEILAGTYTTTDETLTIDDEGVIFYQSLATGCSGNGTAAIIDPRFNMYRVTIEVDGCTTDDANLRNGVSFTGLANIGENNDLTGATLNRTFEMAVSARHNAMGEYHVTWFLRANGN
jgi:hypothetical protein